MQYPSSKAKPPAYSLFQDEDEANQSTADSADVDAIPLHQATPEQLREIIRRREAKAKAEDEMGSDDPVWINAVES
jgi:hypothetical protein